MRNRHIPRLCGSCERPLASQEKACWSCGAWLPARQPRPTLIALPGGGGRPIPIEADDAGHDIAVAVALPVPAR